MEKVTATEMVKATDNIQSLYKQRKPLYEAAFSVYNIMY